MDATTQGAAPMNRRVVREILAAAGAVGGALLGVAAFTWLLRQGFYGLILPGAMLGAGCGSLSASRSNVRGGLCATAGLFVGMFADWRTNAPVETFAHYVLDIGRQGPYTLLMLALGAVSAGYFGRDAFVPPGRRRGGVDGPMGRG